MQNIINLRPKQPQKQMKADIITHYLFICLFVFLSYNLSAIILLFWEKVLPVNMLKLTFL